MFQESVSEIPSLLASMYSWLTPSVFFVLLNIMIGTIVFTSTFANKITKNQNQNDDDTHHHQTKIIARSTSVLQRLKSTKMYSYYNRSQQDPDQNLSVYEQTLDSEQNLEIESQYFFQENSVKDPQISSSGTFSPGNLQTSQPSASNPIFEQTHEQNPQKSKTHFSLEQKEPNLGDFKKAREETVEENEEWQSMDEVYSQLDGGHFSRTKSDTEPSSGEIPVKIAASMKKSASLKSMFGHFEEEKVVEARRPATVREKSGNARVTEGDKEVDAKADDFINKFKHQLKLQRLDSILRYKDMIGRGSGGT